MVVGRREIARRRMQVAEEHRHANLLAVVETVKDFLRDRADRNDLIVSVENARVSALGAKAAASEYARIAAEVPEYEEEESYV